jgi:hypothetical protein
VQERPTADLAEELLDVGRSPHRPRYLVEHVAAALAAMRAARLIAHHRAVTCAPPVSRPLQSDQTRVKIIRNASIAELSTAI